MVIENKLLDGEKEMIEGYKKTAKLGIEISKEWRAAEKESNLFLVDH